MGCGCAKRAKFTPRSIAEDARRDYAGEEDAAQAAIADESDHSWPEVYATEDSQDCIEGEEEVRCPVERVDDGPLCAFFQAVRVTITCNFRHIIQRGQRVGEGAAPALSIVVVDRGTLVLGHVVVELVRLGCRF